MPYATSCFCFLRVRYILLVLGWEPYVTPVRWNLRFQQSFFETKLNYTVIAKLSMQLRRCSFVKILKSFFKIFILLIFINIYKK